MNDTKYLKLLGKRISTLRKKNFTQEEFAKHTGIPRNTIARIERGKINSTINMLRRVAKGLKVSVARLVEVKQLVDYLNPLNKSSISIPIASQSFLSILSEGLVLPASILDIFDFSILQRPATSTAVSPVDFLTLRSC